MTGDAPVHTIGVDLGPRSYAIIIGAGVITQVGEYVARQTKLTHAVIITDDTVRGLYADAASRSITAAGARVDVMSVAPGEPSKSVEYANDLWRRMLACGADRKTVVIALGGGVVGDLAGFIAATFARGVPLVQIPTTLLAHVDSSVGGKVGVNLPGAKNMVGAFWQPAGVLIDTRTLHSLPEREYRAGLAEVVKYGVILDSDFFAYLEDHVAPIQQRDDHVLGEVVARCCRLKADVVQADEREETGARAVLNYGHTFGHALEAVTGYHQLLHGEAVAIGMMCAARLAHSLGKVDATFIARQEQLLQALGLPLTTPQADPQQLADAMQRDKKVQHGKLRFVLPTKMGHVELVPDVPQSPALAAFWV